MASEIFKGISLYRCHFQHWYSNGYKLVNVHIMVINKYQNKHISPLTALKLRHVIHPVQDLNRSQ